MPNGWIIFEESTAERVCGKVLIPAFAPRLGDVRTVSALGASKVPVLFEDLRRVVLFAHLSEKYRHKAWALAAGAIDALRKIERHMFSS